MNWKYYLFILLIIMLTSCINTSNKTSNNSECIQMLVSSYAPAADDGIRLYQFNQNTGQAQLICGLTGVSNPSFVEVAPDNRHFYAVSEEDDSTAALFAAEIVKDNNTTSMRILNSQPTGGSSPCYVKIFPQQNKVFTANYGGGSFTLFNIDQQTGTLLPNKQVKHFQDSSRIHCVEFTPDSAYYIVNDLGTHHVMLFSANDTSFQPYYNAVEQGSGPRHITFAPNGKYAYLINEKSGKITVFKYNGTTKLEIIQYAVCDSVGGHGSADIHISNDGKFLYASNRLVQDGISIFSIDPNNGKLNKIGYQLTGIHPRNFALTPNNKYLLCACRDSNMIEVYERDAQTGLLKNTSFNIPMSQPTCIKFLH